MNKNNLGCGKKFKRINGKDIETNKEPDFICGVANGWGKETLCQTCYFNLKIKWREDDLKELKGGIKNE
jgi:hypothetical protein